MRKIKSYKILLFPLFCFFLLSFASANAKVTVMVIGGAAVTSCVGSSYCEDFEGTGEPSGWSTINGSPNYDDTTNNIQGAQSLSLQIARVRYENATANGTKYVTFKWNGLGDVTPVNSEKLLFIDEEDGTDACYLHIFASGSIRIQAVGGTTIDSEFTPSLNTDYYFKVMYTKGGANSVCSFWYSTDGYTWTGPTTSSDGNHTVDAADFELSALTEANGGPAETWVYDLFKESDSDIPDAR